MIGPALLQILSFVNEFHTNYGWLLTDKTLWIPISFKRFLCPGSLSFKFFQGGSHIKQLEEYIKCMPSYKNRAGLPLCGPISCHSSCSGTELLFGQMGVWRSWNVDHWKGPLRITLLLLLIVRPLNTQQLWGSMGSNGPVWTTLRICFYTLWTDFGYGMFRFDQEHKESSVRFRIRNLLVKAGKVSPPHRLLLPCAWKG